MSRVTEAEIAKAIEDYLEEKTNGQASIQELASKSHPRSDYAIRRRFGPIDNPAQ
jgi:hypothetical protein